MANIDLTIADIILKSEVLSPLVTKGDIITSEEADKNFIAIYNDVARLVAQYNGGNPKVQGGFSLINDVAEANNYKTEVVAGVLTLSYCDTIDGTYTKIIEWDMANLKSTNYAYPFSRFYSCLELSSTPLALTVASGATEQITNGTSDALVNTISDGYLAFANDTLTVQNLPTGYSAWIKCTALVEYVGSDSGGNLELIINGKSFKTKGSDTTNSFVLPYDCVFSVINTDVLDISIKNNSLDSNTLSIKRLFADFELIKIYATP